MSSPASDTGPATDTDLEVDLDRDDTPTPGTLRTPRRSVRTQRWMRWLHVYTSMISLLLVLFFGLTGITLNHPSWTLGDDPERTTETGTLPTELLPAAGASEADVDLLAISEYARDELGVHGSVGDYGVDGTDGSITYQAAGYLADLTFDTATGDYQLVVDQQGFVGVLNDLHKGRDTTSSWKWVIDIAAVFLVVVAVTGLGIQLVYRKRRRLALALAAGASLVAVGLLIVGRG